MTRNVSFHSFWNGHPLCQVVSESPMNWNGVTGIIKIAQIVMVIPMHLRQSQLLLCQRNRCFPEATLMPISRRWSRYNVPRSGAVPRSVDVSRLFPDLVTKLLTCAISEIQSYHAHILDTTFETSAQFIYSKWRLKDRCCWQADIIYWYR